MSSHPVKLFGFVGVASLLAAAVISQKFDPGEAVRPNHIAAHPAKSSASQAAPNFQPAAAVESKRVNATGYGSVVLKPDRGGQYNARIEIDGQHLTTLVDTGATVIALRHEDAIRLGINVSPSDYTASVSTANGELKAARTRLREVRLENISVRDVDAVIMPSGALHQSLLGMSFMKKLSGFEISGGELILKP